MIKNTPKRKINWKIIISVMITYSFMIGTAAISFSHIVVVSERLGLTWDAWTVPWLIDGLAILGLIGRAPTNRKGTRLGGLVLVTVGGALSLTCNVMAGENLGRKLYGVLIVGVFVLSEWYSGKLRETPATVTPTGKACPAGCLCGKHKPRRRPAKGKTTTTRQRRPKAVSEAARLDQDFALPSAPDPVIGKPSII